MAFNQRLKELREAAGLTQAQLAERAGLHRMGGAKLEQGQREPAWPTLQALASALGVGVDAFSEPPAPPPAPKKRAAGKPREA